MLLKRALILAAVLGFGLSSDVGCKDKKESETPGDSELGLKDNSRSGPSESNEDDFVSYGDGSDDEEVIEDDGEEEALERPEVKEVCKGRGKKRSCKMVDSNPKLTAYLGVKALSRGYKWGMSPDDVIKVLGREIEKEYKKRQKNAKGAQDHDSNRKWKNAQYADLKRGHIRFTSGSRHKWGVSLIQYDFEDDNAEEMVWTRDNTLRKFFFFKDGELWKLVYAFNVTKWPGMKYEEVVDQKFKIWFGVNPVLKVKNDPKDGHALLRYYEWTAKDNSRIRSFDQAGVHGVFVISVVDGDAEESIGERLPNVGVEEKFSDDVGDVLGGSDVKYDEDGNIVQGKPPEDDLD
jgi:hypothetical protein